MLFLGYFFHHLVCMHSSQKTHRQLHAHVNLGSVGSVCVNGGYEWAQKHQQKIDGCKIDSGSRTDSSWSGQRTLKKEEFGFNFFYQPNIGIIVIMSAIFAILTIDGLYLQMQYIDAVHTPTSELWDIDVSGRC